ncbi:MAG: DUF1343 domain-containing protein [Labilithrix sp.]|nr:DUF1343 domain-containing protein [Labilithrix sp.]MCW5811215.1 DUF1343 domain-containing protein [Labilithrix sp.]
MAAPAPVDAGPAEPAYGPEWAALTAPIEAAIAAGKLPGCVVAVGRHDGILFTRAYGSRSLLPEKTVMTADTVFDLASLTKPVATTSSLMVLVDRGQVDLDARASTYVPELARLPPFTVRQLLVHTSGLPAITPLADWSPDRSDLMRRIGALTLKNAPGTTFTYSDVGFVVLQEIVQRVSGKTLMAFAADEVFAPLGMKETGFLPPSDLRARTAPTEWRDGGIIQGDVHDPRAFALGGISGNAGVFSTARDLSRIARALLQRGVLDDKRVFGASVIDRFLARQETPKGGRALGWDLDSSFATHKSPLLSPRAFGHGGYTGTALWIDPDKDLFVVFLSNRVHPDGKGAVNPLVQEVASLAVAAAETKTGIDVLRAESFARLQNARVAVVTNASARAKDGSATVDVLRNGGVSVRAIFTPEHGMGGDREGKIADERYGGIPVYSLYGERTTPAAESLDGVDTIVFDLQDVGVRFYTYASTMKRVMKVAAERHLRFVVLDRPNPIGGVLVQGPVLAEPKGFVNHHALPIRHGMTMGELAGLFAADDKIDLQPEVVKMIGWRRQDPFTTTGLTWTAPSPNLRSVKAVELYPAIGLLESTNVSVGRGTDMPFEIVAAPWLDATAVVRRLSSTPGVAFDVAEVTPRSSVHAGKKCKALKVRVTEPARFEPIRTAIAIATALHEVHPDEWTFDDMNNMLRWPAAMDGIRQGHDPAEIEATWSPQLTTFKTRREAFLLYPP